jgi:hypothetical protein
MASPDACETPGSEGDVVPDEEDNCPRLANPLQDYEDQDAWGDACGPLPQASSITFTYGGCQLNARAASPLLFWVGPLLLGLGLILKVLKMREER